MKACFMGLGYIGLPTAIIAAKHGIQITGVDINPKVVEMTNLGKLHIIEPGMQALLQEVVSSGWLKASTTPDVSDAYFVVVPTILLNILYLRNDNPLSLPPLPVIDLSRQEIEAIKEIEVSPVVLELSEQLMAFMKGHTPFTNPQYSLQNVLTDIGTNEHRFNKVLRYNGFSGFRDYINFNRLQYFKEQAAFRKELTVKDLMFMCGFTWRSSFYRYFASIEKMSPSEYMERLQQEG